MAPQSGGQGGFFYFDTNADKVANDIVGAMTRIEQSLARAQSRDFDQTRNVGNIGAMNPVFDSVRRDIESQQGKLRALMDPARWGGGVIDPGQFAKEWGRVVGGGVRELPNMLAREMASVDKVNATQVDMQSIGRGLGQSYINSAVGYVTQHGTPELARAISGVADNFRKSGLLKDLQQNPVNYMSGTQTLTQSLENRARALDLLRAHMEGRMTSADVAKTGFGPLVADMHANTGKYGIGIDVSEKGAVSVYGPFIDQLKAVNAARKESLGLEQSSRQAIKAEEKALTEMGLAQRVVGENWRKYGSVWLSPNNAEAARRTSVGATSDVNQLDLRNSQSRASSYQAEVDNLKYLMANWDRVRQVGAYEELDGNFYKSKGAHGYERVQNEGMVNRLMERRNDLMDREIQRSTRLVELDGKRVMRGEQANSGFMGGFMGRFHRGEMNFVTSMGAQVASAAAFSLAYGSIFALTGALADVVVQYKDYQDSVTDLEVATRNADTVTTDWVGTLSELSRLSGSNMGAAMDAAARGVRAFTDPLKDGPDRIQAVGTAMADASTRLALIANKDMRDATGDLVSIGSAYDLGPDQMNNIVEAVAQAKRNLGGDPAQISQGLSMIAGSAAEAGFNLQEAADVISLVQARTDQSGQAIATRLSRVFQIMAGSTGKNLAAELGGPYKERTNKNLADQSVNEQLREYARIFAATNDEGVRDRITSALGGTANLREILPLLKEGSRLSEAYKQALNNAGVGTDEFKRKTHNLVGILHMLSGDLKNMKVDLARTNLFAPAAGAILAIEPALHALDLLIKGYDKAADKFGEAFGKDNQKAARETLQTIVALGLNAAIAAQGISMVQQHRIGKVAVAGKAAALSDEAVALIATQTGADAAYVREVQRATQARMAVEAALTANVAKAGTARASAEAIGVAGSRTGTFMGGLGALGRFLVNPWVLGAGAVVGGLALGGKFADSRAADRSIQDQGSRALDVWKRVDMGSAGAAQDLENAAVDLRIAAGQVKETDVGMFGSEARKKKVQEDLDSQSRQMHMLSRRVQMQTAEAVAMDRLNAFGNGVIGTLGDLADGFENIGMAGGTALDQVKGLEEVLTTIPDPKKQRFQADRMAVEIVDGLMTGISKSIPKDGVLGLPLNPADERWSPLSGKPRPTTKVNPPFRNTAEQLQEAFPDKFDTENLNPTAQLSADEAKGLFAAANDPKRLVQQALALMAVQGWRNKPVITKEDKDKLAQALVAQQLDFSMFASDKDAREIADKAVNAASKKFKSPWDAVIPKNFLNDGGLSGVELQKILMGSKEGDKEIPSLLAAQEAGRSYIPSSQLDGTEDRVKGELAALKVLRSFHEPGADLSTINWAIREKQHEILMAALTRINDLREAEEAGAGTNKELRAIRLKWAKIAAVKAMGDPVAIETLFETLDKQTINAVLAYLKARNETMRLAIQHTLEMLATASALLESGGGSRFDQQEGQDQHTAIQGALDRQRKKYRDDKQKLKELQGVVDNRVTPNGDKAEVSDSGSGADKLTAAQRAAQRWAAGVDPDRTVEAARAAVAVARADMAAAKTFQEKTSALQALTSAEDQLSKALASHVSAVAEVAGARTNSPIIQAKGAIASAAAQMRASAAGTDGYLAALASWYQAQWQMRDAILQYKASQDQLKGDMTDPVEQARDALRAARRKLASDARGGAGRDVLSEDRVGVKQSETSLQQSKWDQKLSDMRIAEQLGNISQAQYMRYLENESGRMHKMHNKTRAQIDYMNQIDLELKDAAGSMDGMWNFGDINTRGMAYQMRRFVAEQKKERQANLKAQQAVKMEGYAQTLQSVNINIDGADIAKVRKVLEDLLGKRIRTTQSRRR